MRSPLLSACCLALALLPLQAQSACGTVAPNPVMFGSGGSITVTVKDLTGSGIDLQANCAGRTIRTGMPNGPFVLCVPLNLCGGFSTTGAFGSASNSFFSSCLQPGLYYVEVQYRITGGTGTIFTEWIPFTVINPGDPQLTASNNAQVGQTLLLDLSAPGLPLEPYFTAASLTTNAGQTAGSLFVSLDVDLLFGLTFPVPLPLFVNFQGITDPGGAASLMVNIPNDPSLGNIPLHVQTLMAPLGGGFQLTNTVNLCVLP